MSVAGGSSCSSIWYERVPEILSFLQIAIVLEYMNGGSLGDILQKVCLAVSL